MMMTLGALLTGVVVVEVVIDHSVKSSGNWELIVQQCQNRIVIT